METAIQGKSTLITGGASGIGLACASLFAQQGARVVIADRDEAVGRRAVDALVAGGADAAFVATDVSDSGSVQAMIAATLEVSGGLDYLVNSAGVGGAAQHIHLMDDATFDRAIAINLRGVFLCMKYAIPALMDKGGAIVNIASTAGINSNPLGCDYGASKAGVISLTKSAAKEYAAHQIRVNAVCPGWTDTPMIDELLERVGEAYRDTMIRLTPLRRMGRPAEIAQAVLFLAAEATFVTGSILVADGGTIA